MKTTAVKLSEVDTLNMELNFFMSEAIFQDVKFKVNKLREKVLKAVDEYNDSKNNLIILYGKKSEDGVNYEIDDKIKKGDKLILNPKFIEYNKEIRLLNEVEVEFEHYPFDPSLLKKIKSGNDYRIFYRFFEV
jgi:hypothetical protein